GYGRIEVDVWVVPKQPRSGDAHGVPLDDVIIDNVAAEDAIDQMEVGEGHPAPKVQHRCPTRRSAKHRDQKRQEAVLGGYLRWDRTMLPGRAEELLRMRDGVPHQALTIVPRA